MLSVPMNAKLTVVRIIYLESDESPMCRKLSQLLCCFWKLSLARNEYELWTDWTAGLGNYYKALVPLGLLENLYHLKRSGSVKMEYKAVVFCRGGLMVALMSSYESF